MKPINIYALTRLNDPALMSKVERQMSGRGHYIKIREWETEGLRLFSEKLRSVCRDSYSLTFFYSYTMQKLGKEFDLIRIADDQIVNIELKSGNVSGDAIRNQLIQNRYYLSTLGKPVYYYTYISGQDRLVRLSNSGRLINSNFEELGLLLDNQDGVYEGNIEELFKEDKYLISPITDPGKFLRQEYFLTSQQRDIKKQILKNISDGHMLQGFTGIPGTGKTILLYDIAMQLSHRNTVCLFHFGTHRQELQQLDDRLKRIDFYYCDRKTIPEVSKRYAAIFVDEGHGMGEEAFGVIRRYSSEWNAPVIISYDNMDCVSEAERIGIGAPVIEAEEDFSGFKLTNRIRLNSELSTFLRILFSASKTYRREYPNVIVSYGNDHAEAMNLIRYYEMEGYMFIWDKSMDTSPGMEDTFPGESLTRIESGAVTGKEFDKVVMLLDDSFYYDEKRFLRNTESGSGKEAARIMNLFHGLSRAKHRIALVIVNNMTLMDSIYGILQTDRTP
ncbi:MAG: ATP-binding protein [Lachnospiraceae bacterium]|nr:ATP-binding protein [Lachnospiraceae bacterium]